MSISGREGVGRRAPAGRERRRTRPARGRGDARLPEGAPHGPYDALRVLAACTAGFVVAALALAGAGGVRLSSLGVATLAWLTLCAFVLAGLPHHPHARFGAANTVTTVRAAIVVLLVAAVPEAALADGRLAGAATMPWWWAVSGAAILALALDGVDGWLARATALESAFGARYDMETDALLALVLALAICLGGELGPWVLVLGTLRYLFVAAAALVPALRAPLYPSLRRKAVCVLQIAALCAVATPFVAPPLSSGIALAATLALLFSFGRDTWWLLRRSSSVP